MVAVVSSRNSGENFESRRRGSRNSRRGKTKHDHRNRRSANALKKRHKESFESFALAQSKGEVKGVERIDWRVGLEKHSGNKASSRRSSAFARAPVGEALPNYLVDRTTKLHECIASASKRTKRRGGGVSKILFANCPAQTSLIGLASLQLQLNPVKIVCQIDLASILERGGGSVHRRIKILSENLVKLKSDENEEDNTILLLLPKLETWALACEDSRKRRSRRRRRFDHFKSVGLRHRP